jgi:hypothetical protein
MATVLSDHGAAARDEAARPSPHNLPAIRPPGTRQPDTPVRTHATYVVDGRQYSLVSYRDTAGANCVAVDVNGYWGPPLSGVPVGERNLLGAGITMTTRGEGIAVIYGRAHDSVTTLYAVMKDRKRMDWPVHDDAESGERYFAVIADCEAVADIVATAAARKASLKRFFPIWFSKAS